MLGLHYALHKFFNIHKRAGFTKNNGFVSPIVFKIKQTETKGHATLIFHGINVD